MEEFVGYTVGVPTGDTYQMHVRATPFMTRAAAEDLLARLRDENWDAEGVVCSIYFKAP